MRHWLVVSLMAGTLTAAPAMAAERTLSFRVSSACDCAECAFCAKREIPKIPGVKQARLSVKDRRLDVTFDDAGKPVSALAQAISRTDLGKACSLVWPVASGTDAQRLATALSGVQGVGAAKVDSKAKAVLLTFTPQSMVSMAQLDAASKEVARAAS